jgi:hypothetical protein
MVAQKEKLEVDWTVGPLVGLKVPLLVEWTVAMMVDWTVGS